MNDFETLILNPESKLIPIEALTAHSRTRITSSNASYVLSRPGTRSGAIVLDSSAGMLVRLFSEPSTFPQALHALAKSLGKNSNDVVEAALPLLKRLVKDRHIISSAIEISSKRREEGRKLDIGEFFHEMRIMERVQVLDDTQVYKVKLESGQIAALKLLSKRHPSVVASFCREVAILKHLQGGAAPRLLTSCLEGDEIFIVLEWIDGFSLSDWCGRIRNLPHEEAHKQLKGLAIQVLEEYKVLHSKDVLHSDVWMKNILMDLESRVRILDFGLAWYAPANEEFESPIRAANPYFRAPDLAEAELKRSEPPRPTVQSEIYGLGAVIYMMMTGRSYVDFSLEQEVQMMEVMQKPMVSFARRGLPSWDDVEDLLKDMLAKDPAKRPQSVEECLVRLRSASLPPVSSVAKSAGQEDPMPLLRSYVGDSLSKPFPAPSASLVYGAAGVGYAFLRAACFLGEQKLLNESDFMTVRAREYIDAGPDGAFSEPLGITSKVVGPYSIHHRSEGVALQEALIAHSSNDVLSLRMACFRFINGVHEQPAEMEFAFGKAGLLNAILQLSFLVVENESLIKVGREIVGSMLAELDPEIPLSESPIRFLGFAHGWAGILYSLLAWSRAYDPDLLDHILPFLFKLEELKVKCPLGAYWPKHFDRPLHEGDSATWCNGTGGFVLLWSEAFEATRDNRWLALAREAGTMTALHHEMGYNVCCGLAGRAFCLASLYRVTGDLFWIEQASTCIGRAKPSRGSHLHSLFKGVIGLELARIELSRPEMMIFPTLANRNHGAPMIVGAL
jgi:serine/threonine protein kinase